MPTLRAVGHAESHANAGDQLAVAHALRAEGFDASEDGTGRGTPIVPVRMDGYRPTAERGRFEIVMDEAEIVRRIMHEYAAGISPRTIAKTLNAEGIPGPRGGTWKGNTILGDRTLGVGIVNNRLHIGDVIWNRSTWRKNPRTGRRQPFALPESQWVVTRADHLRIVD